MKSKYASYGFEGKHHSREAKKKLSDSNRGKKIPEETRKKISETMKRRRATDLPPWNVGISGCRKGKTFIEQYGQTRTNEILKKMSIGNMGKPSPMKNKCHSEESKRKESINQKKRFIGLEYRSFKGDKKEYRKLHHDVSKLKPKIDCCEHCKKQKKLELANISGKYKLNIDDYLWLCRSCHRKYDSSFSKKIQGVAKSTF